MWPLIWSKTHPTNSSDTWRTWGKYEWKLKGTSLGSLTPRNRNRKSLISTLDNDDTDDKELLQPSLEVFFRQDTDDKQELRNWTMQSLLNDVKACEEYVTQTQTQPDLEDDEELEEGEIIVLTKRA